MEWLPSVGMIIGAALVVIGCFHLVIGWNNVRAFENTFGFCAGLTPSERRLQQASIDNVLERYAIALDEAYALEEYRLTSTTNADPKKSVEALRIAQADVRLHKKWFWDAHALAKRLGFKVRSSYKDYLPVGYQRHSRQ